MAQRNGLIKLGFIVTAFLEAFLLGLIPVKSQVFRESPKVLGIANAFSGGVFLAIALMHILPEQLEGYKSLDINHELKEFPLPFLLLVCGYTLILVIDRVLFDAHSDDDEDDHSKEKRK